MKPRWRRDVRELYFIAPDDGLMAVDVSQEKVAPPETVITVVLNWWAQLKN